MIDKKILANLLKTISTYVGQLYVYGGKGQVATIEWVKKRAIKDPSYFTKGRLEYLIRRIENDPKLRAFDCSGLITKALEEIELAPKGFRNSTNAQKLYANYCKPIGTVKSSFPGIVAKDDADPEVGDLVFRKVGKKMVHVAIVESKVANDYRLIEAIGSAFGVRFTYLYDRKMRSDVDGRLHDRPKFTHIGRLRMLGEV